MKRSIVFLFVITLCCTIVHAKTTALPNSVITIKKDSIFRISVVCASELAHTEELPDVLQDGLIQASVTDSAQRYIDLAQALLDKVESAQNFITNIDANSRFELPVGLTKTIGGISYKLVIHAVRLKPTHAELDMFLQFEIPQNQKKLTFMARGIKLTKKGGIVGDAKLELLGDNAINFSGDKIQLILKGGSPAGGSGTYAIIDCDGFREVSVDAEVKFSRDLVVPENADGKVIQGNVYAGFKATLTDWNDMLIQLNMPAFQVTSLKDFGFKASDVVFDFSDTRNAPAVVFPEGYINTSALPGNENLWRGFYMRELLVRIPPQFQKKGGAGTELRAQNMLIDNRGVSGLFSATNIIPLTEGNMNGWAFSLDSVAVKLMANELQQAGFGGQVIIPVSKETTPFNYTAFISADNDYLFTVAPTENLEFDLWQAHVDIYEGSSLEIRIVDNKFLPKAILHGRMSISAKLGDENGKGVELADIQFEDLQLQAVKPYLKVGNFSFGSEAAQQKMAQFPISIQNIGLRSLSDTETALDFNLLLNLVGENNGAFAADAGLSLIANIGTTQSGNQKWKLKDIEVRSIKIDIDGGAFKFNGSLAFYKKDVVYGNGFNGQVNAEFTPGLKVKCTAIFGNVDGMRYWYADAMVNFNAGIPIFTGVGIYGFGGGAYFAMKMDNQGLGSDLGRTVSGVVYVPDTQAGLGIKAVVSIGSHPKPEAFNGDVTFEIAFFRGGGVRRIALSGNAFLVTPGLELNLDKLKQATNKMVAAVKKIDGAVSSATGGLLAGESGGTNSMDEIFGSLSAAGDKGQISAHASIEYDFENRVLHGNFEAFVNVAGGIVQGVGAGGRAGWAVLHFAPKEWYVYVGTPDDRIGLSVGIASIRATATSYMMVGTKILDSPPPPPKVSEILGGEDLDYMSDLNAIGEGGGFAFGASFEVSTGNLNFLMFYARFEAGAGFDIMLKDYGDTRCKGSNSRIGINGWYANGQAYAYFEGEVGIRVRVFGKSKKIEILSIGAAAVLQAKLPNPFWMRGVVGGRFSVLGGLVSGNCKFRVTLGKECEIVQDDDAILDDIKVIAELTPANDEMDVDVFTTPQALFNIPVEQVFELVDEVNGNIKRSFRVKLDHVKLIVDKKELESSYKWNAKNDVLAVNSFEILPPKSEVTVSVQVSFEEFKSGQWVGVQVNGVRTIEKLEQKFKTGEAPTYIPHRNVEFSYPAIGHVNLYKDESRNGYIKLVQGQSYLFKDDSRWKREGRFIGVSGDKVVVDFTYIESAKQVNFEIPTSLKTDQVYTLELFNVPVATGGDIDRNVTQVSNKVSVGGETLDTEIASKKAEGTIEDLQEQTVYSALLRSSSYSTFSQKVSSFQYSMGWTWQLQVGVRELGTTLTGNECFDKYEIGSDLQENNLVRFEADLTDNLWYQLVYPITYQNYPILGRATINRSIEPLGFPPTKAVFMKQLSEPPLLTAGNSTSIKSLFSAQRAIVYNLSLEMYRDFTTIRAKCADLSLTNNSDLIHRILYATFPSIREGDYKVKIGYYLPGSKQVNSEQSKVISYSRN